VPASGAVPIHHPDEEVWIELTGGAGYGEPTARSREALERDLENGYITREGALRDYGYAAAEVETPVAVPDLARANR
jgi:N-methylhydantoinase B/oxoprolinase/acetone carboxylase alpha subunit